MALKNIVLLALFFGSVLGVRINFTSCQHAEWSCTNSLARNIVYSCNEVKSDDFVIHLKDFYTDHITSLTVRNCRDLKVVLDCPILQRTSQLQRFRIKDCDKLEFVTLSTSSLLQTPPEVVIENVQEIISFPRKMFKSPTSSTEQMCLGAATLKKIHVVNSKINSLESNSIYNVTDISSIEFENVTISHIQNQAIEAVMNNSNSVFSIINSRLENIDYKGIIVKSVKSIFTNNIFGNVISNALNLSSDQLTIARNRFKEIGANGLILKSVSAEITMNEIDILKSNALANVKCLRKRNRKKQLNFTENKITTVEPNSLFIDYTSCKSAGTAVNISNNKIDCRCRHISYLTHSTNFEFSRLILETTNNNTCLAAPCTLPVEIVKLLQESDMCHLNLDLQVMCFIYSDKHPNNNEVTDDDVTEPPPTLYLLRSANTPNGDPSALTAMNKDDLLRDTHLNMTNRTVVKVVFDSSKDFVETLRSTSSSRKYVLQEPKNSQNEGGRGQEYVNRCVGPRCRTNAYDRQKALEFYKYVYAQLRPPRQNDNKKKKT